MSHHPKSAAALIAVAAACATAAPPQYHITELDAFGGEGSLARGVNNLGDVVGMAELPGTFETAGFYYHDGQFYDVSTDEIDVLDITDVNDSGVSVGYGMWSSPDCYGGIGSFAVGIVKIPGQDAQRLPMSDPCLSAHPRKINERGDVIAHQYWWSLDDDGSYEVGVHVPGTLPGFPLGPEDINDDRLIAGTGVGTTGQFTPMVHDANTGITTELAMPDAIRGRALGIDNTGNVYGVLADVQTNALQPVIWRAEIDDNGAIVGWTVEEIPLLPPPIDGGEAIDANENGWIIGIDEWHAQPVPRVVPPQPWLMVDGVKHAIHDLLVDDSSWYTITGISEINDSGVIVGFAEVPGSVVLRAIVLTPVCTADFDGDGSTGVADLLSYLGSFRTGDPRADLDDDGEVTVDDLLAYLAAFRQGC